ncbi:MAG TPA: peptidylprolyl isomerase [Phototrophicaceae bacterium]|nr:peptidylprolyl isomerase [Phototrophicaceae bacterium]
MRKLFGFVLVLAVLGSAGLVSAQDAQTPTQICDAALPAAEPATRTFTEAEDVLEPGTDYRAILCTEAGPVYIDLFENLTPVTVNSFVFLAQQGYYNNTTFHRVIQDFMVQGGDPTGTGTGGPGYQFQDEFVGFLNFDVPGWLAMANAGAGTNGSQFFITTVPTEHLDFKHTIFGQVLEGTENVATIKLRDPETATEAGTALQTVVIVTDADTVTTTFEDPASLTQDEVVQAFDKIGETITPEVAEMLTQATTVSTTAEVVAAAPAAAQTALAETLEQNKHEYRASNTVTNVACDIDNLGFGAITYTLDAFATPEDAAAALASEYLTQVAEANGFTGQTSENLPNALFTKTETVCDKEMVHAQTSWQRGHLIATAAITFPAADPNAQDIDMVLSQFVAMQVYEPILSEVLRAELR